jgi:hypothetical protein
VFPAIPVTFQKMVRCGIDRPSSMVKSGAVAERLVSRQGAMKRVAALIRKANFCRFIAMQQGFLHLRFWQVVA